MPLTRTALQLETSARQRADCVGSSFRDSAAVRQYLSESCRALVTQLVDAYEDDYWSLSATLPTVPGQNWAALSTLASPQQFWKVVRLLVTINGTRDKLDLAGLDEIDTESTFGPKGWTNFPKYRLRGANVWWSITPTAVHTVTVDFVPTQIFLTAALTTSADLIADTDTFDGVMGWDTWAVLDTAIKLRSDESKDTSALYAELYGADGAGGVNERVMSAAAARVSSEPERVRDSWRRSNAYPDPRYPWVDR